MTRIVLEELAAVIAAELITLAILIAVA